MTIQETLNKLKEGNQRFQDEKLNHNLQNLQRREETVNGQDPHTIVLSCADSRVIPELAFDTGIGELFVLRVAGNIANTSTIASIEYAVANLNSKVIVVLGHQNCGAVTAAVSGGDNGYNLNHLLSHIQPALCSSNSSNVNDIIKVNAQMNAEELVNRSTIIANAVNKNKIKIVSAYYNLDTGKVDFIDR